MFFLGRAHLRILLRFLSRRPGRLSYLNMYYSSVFAYVLVCILNLVHFLMSCISSTIRWGEFISGLVFRLWSSEMIHVLDFLRWAGSYLVLKFPISCLSVRMAVRCLGEALGGLSFSCIWIISRIHLILHTPATLSNFWRRKKWAIPTLSICICSLTRPAFVLIAWFLRRNLFIRQIWDLCRWRMRRTFLLYGTNGISLDSVCIGSIRRFIRIREILPPFAFVQIYGFAISVDSSSRLHFARTALLYANYFFFSFDKVLRPTDMAGRIRGNFFVFCTLSSILRRAFLYRATGTLSHPKKTNPKC